MNYDPRKAIRQAMMIARREVTAPSKASIKGQRHMLAYITPYEAELLMRRGGSGRLTQYGIPAFDDGDGDGPGGGDTSNADPGTQSAGAGNEGTGAGPTGAGIGGIGVDSQDDVGGPPGPPGGPNSGFGSSMSQDPEGTPAAANMNTAVSAQQQGYGVGIADTGGVAPTGFGAAPGIAEAFDAYDKGIIGLNQALGYAALSAFSPPGLEFGQVTDEVGNQAVGGRGNIGGAIGGIAGIASGVPGAGTVGGMIGSQVADALGVPSQTFSFADGGAVGYADGGMPGADPAVQQALDITRQVQPSAPQIAATVQPQAKPAQYKSWADVPTINPQDLVGKRVFPIFAELTKAGSAFTGIDASQLTKPEQLYGGPGYPLLPESQEKGLAWAVEGKGRGSAKIRKDADYVVVSSMMPHSHQSNASFSNALMKNMDAYVRDKRLAPEDIQQIDDMIRRPTEQKELQGLQEFPGFAHPEAENFLRGISFEQRKRISNVLASKEAQNLGAPNIDKITRETLDPEFSGVPSRHGMFLLEIPKGTEEQQLVNLKEAGLPEHPSYQYGIKGRVVGKFHYPVAPEVLFKDWFDKAHAEASQKEKSNVRRAFDLAMPVGTVTQEIADMLPRHPRDIQSGKAARLALNAFNDQWAHTDDPVNKGGIGAAEFSQALKNSDFSSTLPQYSAEDINKMRKDKNFTGYKLKDGEIYFGLKRNTNYADDYGFEHPELSPNETALVSVVNNEPGAKGIGGAPVVLKAIQEGATALDCYAVPSQKHPEGFLPNFYSHFNFKELGRIPFDPQYVTQAQFDDMKHQWRKSGWDETMGMPSLVIMKWDGKDGDRSDAVRRFVSQSSESVGPRSGGRDVQGTSRSLKQGAGSAVGESGIGGQGDASSDRGAVRADRNARSADRFTRTLSEIKSLSPEEARHFGLDPAEVEVLRQQFLPKAFGGSTVDKALRLTAPARPMVALADLFQRQLRGRPPS